MRLNKLLESFSLGPNGRLFIPYMDFQVEVLHQNDDIFQLLMNPVDLLQLKVVNGSVIFTQDGFPVFAHAGKNINRGTVMCNFSTAEVLNLRSRIKISIPLEKPLLKFQECRIVCRGSLDNWDPHSINFLRKMNLFSIDQVYRIKNQSFLVETPLSYKNLVKPTILLSQDTEILFDMTTDISKINLDEINLKAIGCILESSSQCQFADFLKNRKQFEIIDLRNPRWLHSIKKLPISREIVFTHMESLSRLQSLEEKNLSDDSIDNVASILSTRQSIFLVNSCHEIPPKVRQLVKTPFLTPKNLLCSLDIDENMIRPFDYRVDKARTSEIPLVAWDEIGGQEDVKSLLRQSARWGHNEVDKLDKFGLRPPKGILLYGPPGCSKTLLVKALASENSASFFSIRGPEIFCKWVGDSEKKIREIFEKARLCKPSLIFFDEFDSIAKRVPGSSVADRVINQLLSELDGAQSQEGVLVIAATNRPDDEAILRPGRFDRSVYVPLPDYNCIVHILTILSKRHNFDEKLSLEETAQKLRGYSGAEICSIFQAAAIEALKGNSMNTCFISAANVENVIRNMKPRTPSNLLDIYNRWGKSKK